MANPNRVNEEQIPTVRVDASGSLAVVDWSELWHYREMLYFLILRDLKLRFRQTVLGVAWAIIQPVTTMIVFTIFFGNVAQVSSDGIPYPIFSFAALVPWTFFTNGVAVASDSLVGQAHLVRKVYFPRILIPLGRVLGGLVDFGIALIVLVLMMLGYGYLPSLTTLIMIPILCVLLLAITFGVSLWLSALNVRYRDVRYLIPFVLQLWLFITPIVYPSSLIKEPMRTLYGLNPMVGVIEGFRWALLNNNQLSTSALLVSVVVAILGLISGLWFFHQAEGTFADII
jgi:lipopolysaccharide transport system permease protein